LETAPVELALGHAYPNPSPASVTLRYAIPSPSDAALRVYDASGRLVRVLAEGLMPAGEHLAVWDRRTDHGTRAAAGIYFCDLRASGRHVTRRIVLL
jgi:flagellar hook assembly protein FlgD